MAFLSGIICVCVLVCPVIWKDVPLMTRAGSFCNLKAHANLATEDVIFECFDSLDTLSDWASCMEKKVRWLPLKASYEYN